MLFVQLCGQAPLWGQVGGAPLQIRERELEVLADDLAPTVQSSGKKAVNNEHPTAFSNDADADRHDHARPRRQLRELEVLADGKVAARDHGIN